jgi:hypothetical protein
MADERNLHEDFSYVRDVLDRAQGEARNSASIYFLWAAISFFGYAIIDFTPEKTGFYWMIAGPAGGILSGVLGKRAARRAGRASSRAGRVETLHWASLLVGILLLVPLVTTGAIPGGELPRIILLLVAVAYFTAGLHLDRRMIPVAAVLAACYLLTVFARGLPYLWTVTGGILAAALVVAGLAAAVRARREAAGSPA